MTRPEDTAATSKPTALIVSTAAKELLEEINELLVDGYAGRAGVLLGDFLDRVIVA